MTALKVKGARIETTFDMMDDCHRVNIRFSLRPQTLVDHPALADMLRVMCDTGTLEIRDYVENSKAVSDDKPVQETIEGPQAGTW